MAIDNVRAQVSDAIAGGANIIILSDRYADAESAPIPALLVTSAVHHHLVREKTRTRVGLVIETGEAREVHHFCLLLGFGAGAINPYLAFDTIRDLCREGVLSGLTERKAVKNYVKAAGKGILKVMSKMGISTVASYTGAQIFEAVGLQKTLVDEYFTGCRVAHRGHRPRRDRLGGRRRATTSRTPIGPKSSRTASCRSAASTSGGARGVPPLQPRHRLQAAALDAHRALRRLQGVHTPRRQPGRAPGHLARALRVEGGRTAAGPDRRSAARRGDREALLHWRDELRVDLEGSARDARHRDEPHRRAFEHGRRRRGPRPVRADAERRLEALGDQAGRVRPLRRDERVPRERRRPPDQDGARREARGGRRTPGLQGVPVDRQDPALHAGRRASSRRRRTTTSIRSKTSSSSSTT